MTPQIVQKFIPIVLCLLITACGSSGTITQTSSSSNSSSSTSSSSSSTSSSSGGVASSSSSSSGNLVDNLPDNFIFASRRTALLNSDTTSAVITITGFNTLLPITISGGEYSVDNGPFTYQQQNVLSGQTIQLKVKSANLVGEKKVAVLTVGNLTVPFEVSTFASETLIPQTLYITHAAQLDLVVGQVFMNRPSTDNDSTGEYVFFSSDKTIATVNSNGEVTANAIGEATITAIKQADEKYASATANYSLNVKAGKPQIPASLDKLQRRDNPSIAFFKNKYWLIGQGFDTDSRSNTTEIWTSEDAVNWQLQANLNFFGGRKEPKILVFKNKLWLFGGSNEHEKNAEAWSSLDGEEWEKTDMTMEVNTSLIVEFKDRLWMLQGKRLWSSTDGKIWVYVSILPFTSTGYDRMVIFNKKLWYIGGGYWNPIPDGNIWSSLDGEQWNHEILTNKFPDRDRHQVIVFHDQLWLIGGFGTDGKLLGDVWSSRDGQHWIAQTPKTEFITRKKHALVVNNDRIILIGGENDSNLYGIWGSSDGVKWQELAK